MRLFVAVEVPAHVRDAVDAATEPLRRRQPAARWVAPNAYHLTLQFVGWVDDAGARSVEGACAEAAGSVGPFALRLTGGAGMFGNGVLWAALEDSRGLHAVAAALREAMVAGGLSVEERPFHAHLTLARAGRTTRLPRDLAGAYDGPPSGWEVERLVLLRSRLRRTGAEYSPRGAWLLQG